MINSNKIYLDEVSSSTHIVTIDVTHYCIFACILKSLLIQCSRSLLVVSIQISLGLMAH
jgi:hypothetical protein